MISTRRFPKCCQPSGESLSTASPALRWASTHRHRSRRLRRRRGWTMRHPSKREDRPASPPIEAKNNRSARETIEAGFRRARGASLIIPSWILRRGIFSPGAAAVSSQLICTEPICVGLRSTVGSCSRTICSPKNSCELVCLRSRYRISTGSTLSLRRRPHRVVQCSVGDGGTHFRYSGSLRPLTRMSLITRCFL